MADLQTLINKYCAGELSQPEKQLLIETLEEKITDFSDFEYAAFLGLVNEKEAIKSKKDPELRMILDKIENRLDINKEQPPVYPINYRKEWKWVAAAAVFFGIVCSMWWLINRPLQSKNIASSTESAVWVTFRNGDNSIKDTLLSDGSIIKLFPNTEISFANGFKEKSRDIKLSGKALFKVARDTSRPFIVYAAGFCTSALGTEFEVSTVSAKTFYVNLVKGKVVVKAIKIGDNPMSDVYLLPGENLKYDLVSKKAIVSNDSEKKEVATKNGNKVKDTDSKGIAPELVFTKLPLQVVFQQLESEYSIVIIYNTYEVNRKEYSGSFNKTDDPKKILTAIAKQFEWKVRIENGTYKIE